MSVANDDEEDELVAKTNRLMVGLGNKELDNAPVMDARVWCRITDRRIRPCAPVRCSDMHTKSVRVCRWEHNAKEIREDGIPRLWVSGMRLPGLLPQ